MIFDTHIHLNSEVYKDNLNELLLKAKDKGVNLFNCVGYDLESSIEAVNIANNFPNVYATIGLIPTEHKKWNDNTINELKELYFKNKKIIAIGEIGLDYYWEKEPILKEKQKEIFIKQIELANELNLPISIHARDSLNDVLEILKTVNCKNTGVLHCFSGSKEQAREFIKLGYKIAFGGVLTFKNSVKTKEVLLDIDLENIVFETDAPYLAPTPYRGKINLPEYIFNVVQEASLLKKVDFKELSKITYENSLKIFHVKRYED